MSAHLPAQLVDTPENTNESGPNGAVVPAVCEPVSEPAPEPVVLAPAGRALAPVRGRPFPPGVSGNPTGRPRSERKLLARLYGADGRKNVQVLEDLKNDPETSRRLRAQIAMFLLERQFGKAPQMIGLEGGPSLIELLADVAARTSTPKADSE